MEPICIKCKHFNEISGGCKAFPAGIPEIIAEGLDEHKTPLPDQPNKIVFEPIAD